MELYNSIDHARKISSSRDFIKANDKTPDFVKLAQKDEIDPSNQLQLTQESSILTTFSTTMNCTHQSGLQVREFLNS